MKRTILLAFAVIMAFTSFTCTAQVNKKQSPANAPKVEVYYFHLTSRCPTCLAVESEAKADIQTLYGNKISFKSINLDDESSKAIAEKLQVPGQALLIVKGKEKINLTNDGFMYARKDPAKFKSIIKEKIDALLL